MEKTNRLSRRLDLKVGVEHNNKNQKLIKEEWVREMMEVVIKRLEMGLVKRIKKAGGKDEKIVKVVEEMKKAGAKTLRRDK